MSFPTSEAAVVKRQLLDEHLVIKIGENKVSPRLYPPVHKEEPTIIAFRGHLLFALWSAEMAGVSDALSSGYLGHSRLNSSDIRGRNGSSWIPIDSSARWKNSWREKTKKKRLAKCWFFLFVSHILWSYTYNNTLLQSDTELKSYAYTSYVVSACIT